MQRQAAAAAVVAEVVEAESRKRTAVVRRAGARAETGRRARKLNGAGKR